MTCIVGFTDKKNNVTWMGGDSLGSNGYSKNVNMAGKVFHNDTLPNVVIGGTSTFRHLDLLKYSKNLFPEVDKYKLEKKEITIDHKYMVTSFVPNVIGLFQGGIVSEIDKDRGGCFLIGINGKLFQIQPDYSVLEPQDDYDAVGCGELSARGSLYATTKNNPDFTPKQHIICALEAAEREMCGVKRPFVIINSKGEKEIIE